MSLLEFKSAVNRRVKQITLFRMMHKSSWHDEQARGEENSLRDKRKKNQKTLISSAERAVKWKKHSSTDGVDVKTSSSLLNIGNVINYWFRALMMSFQSGSCKVYLKLKKSQVWKSPTDGLTEDSSL